MEGVALSWRMHVYTRIYVHAGESTGNVLFPSEFGWLLFYGSVKLVNIVLIGISFGYMG